MISSKSHLGSTRGRKVGRSPSNRDTLDDKTSSVFSQAPSISSTNTARRPRGFQPDEVNNPKAKAGTASNSAQTTHGSKSSVVNLAAGRADPSEKGHTVVHFQPLVRSKQERPTGSQIDVKSKTQAKVPSTPEPPRKDRTSVSVAAAQHNGVLLDQEKASTKPKVQTTITHLSKPSSSHSSPNTADKISTSDSSSISIIVDDQSRNSGWSRAIASDSDSPPQAIATKSTADMTTRGIDHSTWETAVGASSPTNRKLYKSTSKSPKLSSASSFARQMANMKGSQLANVTKAEAMVATDLSDTTKTAKTSAADDSQAKTSANATSVVGSAKIPPHLRARGPTAGISANKKDHAFENQRNKVAHQLESSTDKSGVNVLESAVENKVGMQSSELPPHLKRQPVVASASARESRAKAKQPHHGAEAEVKISKQGINLDEEIAASEQYADTENDAGIAAALAEEANNKQMREIISLSPGEETLLPKDASAEPIHSTPPHLRKFEAKNTDPKAMSQPHSPTAKKADMAATSAQDSSIPERSQLVKGNIKSKNQAEMGEPAANSTPSTVDKGKGKELAVKLDPFNDPSNLVDWDGKFAPAPLEEDWSTRIQFRSGNEERLAAIKMWTEDQAVDAEASHLEGQENLINRFDEDHPETLPNPDEFNQAKRHVSANHQIQAYEARLSTNGRCSPPTAGQLTKEERRYHRRVRKELMDSLEQAANENAPKANIYLRPAEMKDMRQIMLLHNYYILKSSCANELVENDEIYWRGRFQECHDEGDPFLVAIHKHQKATKDGTGQQQSSQQRRKKQETIVGFAFASDYGLTRTAYRFTVEMELWVHPEHTGQGIGKSMLDRMLAAQDPGYGLLECAPLLGKADPTRWSGGGCRTIKIIMMNLLHDKAGEENVEWMKNWLSEKNFEHQGTLTEIGHKFGRPLNQCQMVYKTMSSLPHTPIGGTA